MKLLILTDEPNDEYEKVSFTTLQYYCETNNYDLIIKSEYKYYNNLYDYLIYISCKCLIINVNVKLEKLINKKHLVDTYTENDNCVNFLIIKNTSDIIKLLNDFIKYKKIFKVNKNINYLSFLNKYDNLQNDLKNPIFKRKLNEYFFFVYGEIEKNNNYTYINNIMLNYIYNQILNIVYFDKNYIDIDIDFNIYDYTKKIEVFNPNKDIAFVTMYTPNMRNIGIQMEYNMKTYCNKNYTLYIHRTNEMEIDDILVKPYLINTYLKNHKYVIWFDADMLCFDMTFKIENILNDKSLQCFKDIKSFCNTGFLIFKNDKISENIIKDWKIINSQIQPKTDKEFTIFINNKYKEYVDRNNKMEINVPLYYLNSKTKFIHFNVHSFNRILLMEYINYITFILKK